MTNLTVRWYVYGYVTYIWGEQAATWHVIAGVCSSEGDFLFMSVLLEACFRRIMTSYYLSHYLTNLMHKICFTLSFISYLYMFSNTCVHHQEVKIALHSLWYRHTETSEWSKITKIQFYKYEQIVVKFLCEFFGCDYCVLLTINMLCHVELCLSFY
jgi:hypothetical protein